jgi:hypothetical protein
MLTVNKPMIKLFEIDPLQEFTDDFLTFPSFFFIFKVKKSFVGFFSTPNESLVSLPKWIHIKFVLPKDCANKSNKELIASSSPFFSFLPHPCLLGSYFHCYHLTRSISNQSFTTTPLLVLTKTL